MVDFLSHLARDEKGAASTQNQARGHEENTEARVSTVRADGLDSPHVGASLPKGKKDKQKGRITDLAFSYWSPLLAT